MVDKIRPINDDFSSAGQITLEQIQQAGKQGFRSILNLRSQEEDGILADEAEQATAAGLYYAQSPLNPINPESEPLDKALFALNNLPKPVLVHCRGGDRATAVALIAIAHQNNFSREQFVQQVQTHSLSLEQPQIKQFLSERYSQETA